ncbi:hypothetical protein SO802_030026 [Lithocarpus litseifolius]|uniref:RNase H type-1 domain-containing protein n=1 Tax=Lithocarpus litseifolius TaxID=425828 RepID=A0AAW2BVC3_9ROSI
MHAGTEDGNVDLGLVQPQVTLKVYVAAKLIRLQDYRRKLKQDFTDLKLFVGKQMGSSRVAIVAALVFHCFLCSIYKATLSNSQTPRGRDSRCPSTRQQPTVRDWNQIIRIAAAWSRRQCRYGIVYEALTLQADKVFFGVASTTARTATGALLEAVIAAVLAAKAQGFQNNLFITDSKGLMQTIEKECVMDWMDSTRLQTIAS